MIARVLRPCQLSEPIESYIYTRVVASARQGEATLGDPDALPAYPVSEAAACCELYAAMSVLYYGPRASQLH